MKTILLTLALLGVANPLVANDDWPRLRAVGEIPNYDGAEYPATLGQSADDASNVYV